MGKCSSCRSFKNEACGQAIRMTDEEYEDYFIFKINCPYYDARTKGMMDVVCEFMSNTFGKPCNTINQTEIKCNNDCDNSSEACWKRAFVIMKEKKNGQDNT